MTRGLEGQRGWPLRWLAAVVGMVLVAGGLVAVAGVHEGKGRRMREGLPGVMVWSWERSDDLEFLSGRGDGRGGVGVAFLAQTAYVGERGLRVRVRTVGMRAPEGAALVAVTRIESGGRAGEAWAVGQAEELAGAIARLGGIAGVKGIQVDFDARESEREFYGRVLVELRRQASRGVMISMTALASWCMGDAWLEGLPAGTVDEVVPMFFEMGPDGAEVKRKLGAGGRVLAKQCEGSVGISVKEGLPEGVRAGMRGGRIYVFNDAAWTEERFGRVMREVGRWR